jgi:hypothetical protein
MKAEVAFLVVGSKVIDVRPEVSVFDVQLEGHFLPL